MKAAAVEVNTGYKAGETYTVKPELFKILATASALPQGYTFAEGQPTSWEYSVADLPCEIALTASYHRNELMVVTRPPAELKPETPKTPEPPRSEPKLVPEPKTIPVPPKSEPKPAPEPKTIPEPAIEKPTPAAGYVLR